MTAQYSDRWISCDDEAIHIRGYYFPWGTKHIAWGRLRAMRRIPLTGVFGRWRIWGSTNLVTWASLDPSRPRKSEALLLDVGKTIRPAITPDDVDAVARLITSHTTVTIEPGRPLPL